MPNDQYELSILQLLGRIADAQEKSAFALLEIAQNTIPRPADPELYKQTTSQ